MLLVVRDFAAEAAELEALKQTQRDVAVARLRQLHEAWARGRLGLPEEGELVSAVRAAVEAGVDPARAAAAIEQLELAEQHQWEIGTWATGAGEGLASMFEVRALQLARAWLWVTPPPHPDSGHSEATARTLLAAVASDPNDIAGPLRPHIDALTARLQG
jgi:hypothetical protein